jgi:hypothetical protein
LLKVAQRQRLAGIRAASRSHPPASSAPEFVTPYTIANTVQFDYLTESRSVDISTASYHPITASYPIAIYSMHMFRYDPTTSYPFNSSETHAT